MAEDLTGTAGTLDEEPGTTGTPGDDAGTTGTLGADDGTTGTPAAEPKRYRVNVGGRDVELTEEEVVARAQEALGLKTESERRNRELDESRRQAEFYRDRAFGAAPAAPFNGQGAQTSGDLTDLPPGLDENDPRDRVLIANHRRSIALEQQFAQQQIASLLREQHAELAGDKETYPGYNRDRALAIIREGIAQGKRMDLFDAYQIDRGRQAPALDKERRDREDAERDRAAAEARNRGTLGVATVTSGAPQRTANHIPKERIAAMPLSEYKKLKSEGWTPDPRGGLVRRQAS